MGYSINYDCVLFRHNRIWAGRAAGVAVTEEGKGHILHNDICGMEWGGVDIRNGGNPVVTNNWIREGHADGIVIGEGGKGVIMDNDIRGNSLINILTVYNVYTGIICILQQGANTVAE